MNNQQPKGRCGDADSDHGACGTAPARLFLRGRRCADHAPPPPPDPKGTTP